MTVSTSKLFLSYIPSGAPSNGAGARTGLGRTRKEAHESANHWNNQAPYAKTRNVYLVDGQDDSLQIAWGELSWLEDKLVLSADEKIIVNHLRQGRGASAILAYYGLVAAQSE